MERMDPWAPINGLSLEQYAELAAEVDGIQDPEKQAEIVGKLGVARADWEAAKAGWTARMQDASLMGQVATRFMPLYQAALAKKAPGGAPQVSFEDYVAMSGCVPVIGYEGMLQHYKITSAQWTRIAGEWNNKIPTNPQYMQFGILVQQESQRIRAGGQPKPVNMTSGGVAPAPGVPAPGAAAQPTPYVQPNPYGHQASYNAQAQDIGAQIGSAFSAFSNALGSFVDGAIGGFRIGGRVMVQWSDGNRYPGTITNLRGGQIEVAFSDGRRMWVPQGYVNAV